MAILLSPYFWLGSLIGVISLFGVGFYQGHKFATGEQAREQRAAQVKIDKEREKRESIVREIAQDYEVKREKVRTVYIKVKEKADENIDKNPDYGVCGLDDDGLRLYNQKPEVREEIPAARSDG